jgi:CobQ-like glutamine amidotransferase family enzyme/UDP-N-acetylmuramyl tripeptide synthase
VRGGEHTKRARVAARAARFVSFVSRGLGLGGGSVIGGRLGLALDPELLEELARGRTVALVSGTNGKTTTTKLLTAALGGPSRVATSAAGANLPSGVVTALAASSRVAPAVLEVDESYLAIVAEAVRPATITLLNLSRDQLDRMSEVRMIAARWRAAVQGRDHTVVVANADDPLVTWAAQGAPRVVWVAAGQLWHADAVGCPACEGRVVFAGVAGGSDSEDGRGRGDWWCACGFRRPEPDAWLEGDDLVRSDGRSLALRLSLPGRFNRANAAMAVESAGLLGVDRADALAAMRSVGEVEGRFATVSYDGRAVRLLLAKNPAGWTELLDLLREDTDPAVIGINARVADGRDPSWLWDVPFERLAGRLVIATGERCRDLAVRLRHAGVEHLAVRDQLEALAAAGSQQVEYVGNYTAFQQLRRSLQRLELETVPGLVRGTGPKSEAGSASVNRPGLVPESSRGRGHDTTSVLRVVVVHPDLLGTYGDGGNARVLADRAAWRGIGVELVMALSDTALPSGADLYCLGGGEDGPQVHSAQLLSDGTLRRATEAGASVLAVCAGYQVIGESFPDAQGSVRSGAGLLDVATVKGRARRAVGELLAEPFPPAYMSAASKTAGQMAHRRLTGFENHGGVTRLGADVRPLAHVVRGIGNGTGDRTEGAVSGKIIGTYMHGPVLARNPSLADLLLFMATGISLDPLDDAEEEALRLERLAAAGRGRWRAGVEHRGALARQALRELVKVRRG